ncbi:MULTISPECIES: Type-2Aa cytolytic delta-endotoxin [unclassified Streptomyces]|uniref:Type-2Aa cytolytic delta-endotoxin n=1 Tax=unclassified Streptomyces TaxID=2593676 RepID=UPI002E0FCE3D|nr:Type-2Aa cytolytic delta-endotoxin [Streptomyces sp. NBC_01197]WSS49261.1 Type-2Aa cytolytic delta-endotoxin [Streptomyces sp. NBC_01180]
MAGNFKTVIDVGADHLDQARAIDRVFQEAIAPATVNFDFDNIREAAAAIPDGAIVKMIRGWGLQEHAAMGVIVLSLKEAVRQALPDALADAAFWDTIDEEFVRAFTGLGAQEGEPGLSFYEEGVERTSFYRDLFFALQDEETGAGVYAIAFCVDATIGLDKTRVGALKISDVAPFVVRLNAIVVRQELQPAA